ncbi:MAG: DotI/IcmL family type IV secretion protein [Pseudomonadota bacterium]|nr:hypothetical protein [Alphaproteobacteria bacterium]MEC7576857.1 DotI/IcmL family type IV secretion protein [Pseudomonadota bacterium]MEC9236194.1 DotI/IcmL family type IV secretion protein [Pseudomonadota bacterium]|tara:strand:- start:1923 stop:2633 length:711 start_codon:yes stop_codon:yes gene_type:complete
MRKPNHYKKTLLLAVMSAALIGSSLPAAAQSPLDKLKNVFSKEDDGKLKPHETLQAPFSTDGQVETKNKGSLMFLYDQELTGTKDGNILSKPHRTDAQMGEWVQIVVTNLLSFNYKQAQEHINKYQGLFKRGALVQYVNEVNKSDIVKAMRQNGLESVAMFDEMPIVQNKGNFQGIYRWTFDFPVTITFRYTGKNARRNASEHTIVMQVKMRVGRAASDKGADGGIIESWSMERIK